MKPPEILNGHLSSEQVCPTANARSKTRGLQIIFEDVQMCRTSHDCSVGKTRGIIAFSRLGVGGVGEDEGVESVCLSGVRFAKQMMLK
jgi:hypothetical protein